MSVTRRRPGRLGPFVDGYMDWLSEAGYTPKTVQWMLRDLSRLGRWMDARDVAIGGLTMAGVESFLADWPADGAGRVPTVRTLRALLTFLSQVDVMGAEDPKALSPVEGLVVDYRAWLVVDRGLAEPTVVRYETLARRFLTARVTADDRLGVACLDGAVVSQFLLADCDRVCLGSSKGRFAELRSLLRFLHLRGLTTRSLAESIPGVAGWRETTIPATMPQADIEALLASCDPAMLDGARNRAMLMLLARLGVRSIEIARLRLDDLDWRAGDLLVRGKAGRDDRLPLPTDVGDALAGYLALRGAHRSRSVFLTLKAPTRPIRADLIGDVVNRHCRLAGVPHVGPHRLRHTLATRMLAEGAALADISQVLRHSDLATTAIYAKVDLGRLRQVARTWPGASR
jgi:site-specific recombinase XerD